MRRELANLRISRGLMIAGLCIALVLMSGMIQAAHFHADAQADHDCALCLTVHSVAQVTATIAIHLTCFSVEPLYAPRTIARARDAVHFRLASRPPPVSFLAA
ncbi:MAG TPA: hypothetical protein VME68_05000 [Acidobacteriaceae bacterium]|nr:hypothetical protein [Acidobacteriaceae bacterium]